jgi:DNA-binding protein HU-beta
MTNMNRAELISHISELTGQTKTEVGTTITAIIYSITGAMTRGDKVTLVGFGTFERRTRQARTGRNPRTLAPLRIPSSKVPAFRAGQELKDVIDGRSRQKPWAHTESTKGSTPKAPGYKASAKKPAAKPGKSKRR